MSDTQPKNISTAYDWNDDIVFQVGKHTAFGIFDDDQRFKSQSVGVAKYVVRSLGYPHINVQLMPQHIFTAFEASIMKYSTIVNQSKISDNLLNVFGTKLSEAQNLSTAAVYENMGPTFQISSMYGQESIIKNSLNVPIRTAKLKVHQGKQKYDLTEIIPQVGNRNVQLIQVYYYPTMYNRSIDAMIAPGFNTGMVAESFGGTIANNARTTIMPVFQILLKMQAMELSQQIRRSHFGFEIRMNDILFYPPPETEFDVDIDYILKSDKRLNTIKQDSVNNVANFPINDYMRYDSINTVGRNWIHRFTLAICKQLLGLIRSKFSSIPYPQSQISMDGQSLRSEGVQQQDKLIEQLKFLLQESSMFRLIQKKKDMAQNLQSINSKVPSRIFIG